ncbi:hypothetical protein RHGRI_028599 [Rhododendron griersonianum]|uniref:Uncharacterized protein n=1 Tax=Rhododendron griersonianum TaxID=479676 RepID=A0AAV6IK64_9ERIC|nr:hypothetical protein RHGRI_028599 [Rhododendron griersonianum]
MQRPSNGQARLSRIGSESSRIQLTMPTTCWTNSPSKPSNENWRGKGRGVAAQALSKVAAPIADLKTIGSVVPAVTFGANWVSGLKLPKCSTFVTRANS